MAVKDSKACIFSAFLNICETLCHEIKSNGETHE